ncbi:diguanylate cyclase [Clostridiaceae bacterium DONG20-135]|uniref:Diguanylate cyclase n=1 Tax=Copranaerobaculum intestinale TaxID=2692629 RepID=A0A6N8U7N9_9FIRM|nr:GGDEF domain-containing protein [Copranaerobaculum intestinale]MXQ72723.1 diguanylate cyclase [Copranaerobaculum intestinale]
MNRSLRSEAAASYQSMNHQWLKFHYRILQLSVIVSVLAEIAVYIIARLGHFISGSDLHYWLTYILIPGLIGLILIHIGRTVVLHKKLSVRQKEYCMSFLFVLITFNLSFVHSSYVTILFVSIVPLLMTVIYEQKRLTSVTAVFGILLQIISALGIMLHGDTFTSLYLINLVIIILCTCASWAVAIAMIQFARMKKQIIINQDVERKILRQRIHLDELTGVGSRQAMLQHLEMLANEQEQDFFIAMIDIDEFKHINDCYGHLYGDRVLHCFGECMCGLGKTCYPYRFGGDEFCVLFMESHAESVRQLLQRLQKDFSRMMCKINDNSSITFSAGFAKRESDQSMMEIIHFADVALYESKKRSRSAITLYEGRAESF